MAGMEQLEIHSKVSISQVIGAYDAGGTNSWQSYFVRWVKVDEGHTISWSIQPHKKSMYGGDLAMKECH